MCPLLSMNIHRTFKVRTSIGVEFSDIISIRSTNLNKPIKTQFSTMRPLKYIHAIMTFIRSPNEAHIMQTNSNDGAYDTPGIVLYTSLYRKHSPN